jgi:hypothetical protein
MANTLTLLSSAYHRNGICGEGFWAILFQDADQEGTMIASIFHGHEGHCAVYNVEELHKGNVGFGCGNSWRGDHYEDQLRALVDAARKDDEYHTPLVGYAKRQELEEDDALEAATEDIQTATG